MPAETPKLTPTRRKVLEATVAGHVKRDRWGGDVHATPGLARGCCGLSSYQNVRQQVDWLIGAGLIAVTDAGRAALGSPEATEKGTADA